MALRKYRSVDQMPGPPPLTPGAPENLRIAFELSDLALRLSRRVLVPGLRRFRSYEELLESREPLGAHGTRRVVG